MNKFDTAFSIIVPVVKRGNLGKSTFISQLASWLNYLEVPWQGFDLDADHSSFSRLFPESVQLIGLGAEPEGDLLNVIRRANAAPVTLIDPRAHLSQHLLRAWELTRFPENFKENKGRITVLIFPADDLEVMCDMDTVISELTNRVEYVVVKNPAKSPRTRMFDGSELEQELQQLDAKFLEMPALLSLARNHLAALEAELGRGVSALEAISNRELPLDNMVRLVIDDWVRNVFRRFQGIAERILPNSHLQKAVSVDGNTKRKAPVVVRGAKINRTNL
jgi:hypothetical protein